MARMSISATGGSSSEKGQNSPLVFEPTEDVEVIRQVITTPEIYRVSADDHSPPAAEWRPNLAAMFYVLVKDGEELLGLFAFGVENGITVKVHTCLLPNSYGKRAAEAAKGIIQLIFSRTRFQRIVTDVPTYNRLALRFAKQAGLEQFGVNPKSFLKDGVLWDQIELGISKPS